jgi:hypothetical protein
MAEPTLPHVGLSPTQWVRYHWRYTTADNWGRISRGRAPIEKPLWMQADLEAKRLAALSLGEVEIADACREASTPQEWATCTLGLSEAWRAQGGEPQTLGRWLDRQRLQILDELVAST